MPRGVDWRAINGDEIIRHMRGVEGRSFDAIASRLGLSRNCIVNRAAKLRVNLPEAKVEEKPEPVEKRPENLEGSPLPAGHPISWGAITQNTILAGTIYPYKR